MSSCQADPPRPPGAAAPPAAARDRPPARILVATGNSDVLEQVRRTLSPGHEITGVADGDAAWTAVLEHASDLVLAEITMPRLDGYQLFWRLRSDSRTSHIPIILLAGAEEAHGSSAGHGADECLVTPFSAGELLLRVDTHLEAARAGRAAEQHRQHELDRSAANYRALLTELDQAEQARSTDQKRLSGQKEAFRAAVNGAPLRESLGVLAAVVAEEMAGEARTAFYIADQDATVLRPVQRAGDMPDSYTERVDRFRIGHESLACGLATATGLPVVTRDVFDEPLWKPWVHLAAEYGFRGCWSFPIETRDRKPIGTFAMYFREPRDAGPRDLALAAMVTQAAAIIISRHTEGERRARAEEDLSESEEKYRSLFNSMDEGFVLCDIDPADAGRRPDIRCVDANSAAVRMMGTDLVGLTTRELDLHLGPRWFEIFGRVAGSGIGERHELTASSGDAVYNVYVFTTGAPDQRRVAAVFQDITDQKRADERQMLLVRELNHRVKNTLATVQSIANQTLRGTPDPARFVEELTGRLQALSGAHALLTRRSWESADIADIARDQLLPDDGRQFSITGPSTLLEPDSAVALALVLHELATNARKYGSLSSADGHVRVRWTENGEEPAIDLHWLERGGPAVRVPVRRGFGITLIERSVRSIGGSARLDFAETGLRCAIRLPIAQRETMP